MIPYVYPSEHYKAGEGLTSRNGHPLPAYECPEWVLTERHVRRAGWFATHPALGTVQGASDVSQYEAKTVALRTAMHMDIKPIDETCAICEDAPGVVDAVWDERAVKVCRPCFEYETKGIST